MTSLRRAAGAGTTASTARAILPGQRARTAREHVAVALAALAVEVLLHTTTLERTTRLLGIRLDLSGDLPGDLPGDTASAPRRAAAAPPEHTPTPLPAWTRRPVMAVDTVLARWPFRDTCLRRCLVLGWRLRCLSPSLRIGVARRAGGFEAHAWLVLGGRALDPAAADYRDLVAA